MCRLSLSVLSNPTTPAVTTTTTAIAKTTPLDVSGLSQCEIQGLLLGAHPSVASPSSGAGVPASPPPLDHHQQAQHHHGLTSNGVLIAQGSNLSIKREPEDLRKDPSKCPSRSQKVRTMSSCTVSSPFLGKLVEFSHTDPLSDVNGDREMDNGQCLSVRGIQTTLS